MSYRTVVCATALLMLAAAPTAAQDPPREGPFAGLFGESREKPHSLDFRGGLFAASDDNLLAQAPNAGQRGDLLFNPLTQQKGMATGLDSSLAYSLLRTGRRARLGIGAAAGLKEFSSQLGTGALWVPSYGADAGLNVDLTSKVTFGARFGSSYTPFYQYVPFLNGETAAPRSDVLVGPAAPISPVGSDYGFATDSDWVSTVGGSLSITDRFTRRSSVTAEVLVDQSRVFGTASLETRLIRGQFAHRLTKRLGFHVGYGIQENRSSLGFLPNDRLLTHLVDGGIDLGDGGPLSFARHYTLGFAAALRAVRRGADTELRVDGDATLARSLGRTWSTFLGYRRDTTYVLGLGDPLFTDAVTTGVGGQVAPRLHIGAGAAYMKGVGAFSLSDGHVTSKSASTKLTLAISKNVGLYGQYSYYQYGVPDGYFSGFQFAPDFDRRAASVGLSLWVPIINPRPVRRP